MKKIVGLSILTLMAGMAFTGMKNGTDIDSLPFWNPGLPLQERIDDLVSRLTLEEKIAQMMHGAPAIPRLGIPAYNWWNECLHGVARAGLATVFPQPIGLAATFDERAILDMSEIISDEARAKHHEALRRGEHGIYQGLTFWSPNINIFRDPRWGRGMETYGEDPFLTSRLGLAFVKGLQGSDPSRLKTVATAKHFAVHSGPEPERHRFNARPPRRDLFETYLPAFETLVREGHVQSVMCAYNRLYGEPCCGSSPLIQEILRNRWGFDGYVVSDCWAVNDFWERHKVKANREESAALSVKSGTDLECGVSYAGLNQAVSESLITEAEIDTALKRLMKARFQLGMFDPPDRVPWAQIPFSVVGGEGHRKAALETALKSMVLLKNDMRVLPIGPECKTILVCGPNADQDYVLWGNYHGTPRHSVTPLEGIRSRASANMQIIYERGCDWTQEITPEALPPECLQTTTGHSSAERALQAAEKSDLVVMCGGIHAQLEGEQLGIELEGFRGGDRTLLGLPRVQRRFLEALHKSGKPVVLVLLNGSALAVEWEQNHLAAILEAWYPGQEGGAAVAEVLFGGYNPAGRLPVTVYRSVDDLPPFDDYSMSNRTYRYFKGNPLYAFGYGLSYTRFEYKDLAVNRPAISEGEEAKVTFNLKNTGSRDGDEVVQLYVRPLPVRSGDPLLSLKAFSRILVRKNETRRVELTLRARDLRTYDEKLDDLSLRPGKYELLVGAASDDIRLKTILEIVKKNVL